MPSIPSRKHLALKLTRTFSSSLTLTVLVSLTDLFLHLVTSVRSLLGRSRSRDGKCGDSSGVSKGELRCVDSARRGKGNDADRGREQVNRSRNEVSRQEAAWHDKQRHAPRVVVGRISWPLGSDARVIMAVFQGRDRKVGSNEVRVAMRPTRHLLHRARNSIMQVTPPNRACADWCNRSLATDWSAWRYPAGSKLLV